MNKYLEGEIKSFKNKIVEVRSKGESLHDEFVSNISRIIEHLEYAMKFDSVRLSSLNQIKSLKNLPYMEKEDKKWHIKFNNQDINFMHMRINVVGGYLATVWGGQYDNIGVAVDTLYDIKLEKVKNKNTNKKYYSSNFFSVLVKDGYGVLRPVGLLRQKYGLYTSIYYEIRNMFIHGNIELLKSFFKDDPSKYTGFILNETKCEELESRAIDKWNRGDSTKNTISLDDSNSFFKTTESRDLIEIIKILEDKVDKCSADLLYYASHNLDLTRFPEHF